MITAKLSGRSISSLPSPAYEIQNQGTVVVEITVDRDGKVVKAKATAKGSTTQDGRLWKAAEDAARKARFSPKNDAPPFQTGTITYVFTLV
jgi:TonB family protein